MEFEFRENDVNPNQPLLYRISIGSRLYYVGCADDASRPRNDYRRNIERLTDGRPYRKGNPDGFRHIHRQLYDATVSGESIIIELLRNVSRESKFEEERKEIESHRRKFGSRLLNGV